MAIYNTMYFFVIFVLIIHSPTNVARRGVPQDTGCVIGEQIDCNPGTHGSIVDYHVKTRRRFFR